MRRHGRHRITTAASPRLCFLVAAALFLCGLNGSTRRADAQKTAETMSGPFPPSLINTRTGKPVKASEFFSPDICGGCHGELYQQWKGSMHAHSYSDPVFQSLWKRSSQESRGACNRLCTGCHTGTGTEGEEIVLKDGTCQVSSMAAQGVHCDLCHTVVRSAPRQGPASEQHMVSLEVEPGDAKRGPYQDSESPFHQTVYSPLHTQSEFCVSCHNDFHPVAGFHMEGTYEEWKQSVYAQNGIQCQDCHMMPPSQAAATARTLTRGSNPGTPCAMGPERDQVFTHEFTGASVAITGLSGSAGHAEAARQRLKSAAELSLSLPERAAPGALATVDVRVTNAGAGHNLPTSLVEVRQMWVELIIRDVQGTTVYHSGTLDDKGVVDPQARMFNAKAVTRDATRADRPGEINRFEYNHTIPPRGSSTLSYSFALPGAIRGPLTAHARLRYRSFPQELIDSLLGKESFTLPIVDMAEAKGSIMITP